VGKAEAARRAGFQKSRAKITACELMKHPEVQKEIERRLAKKLARTSITSDTVLDELLDIIEACKEAGAGAWQMTARLKAAELLGKHLKMFSDRVEVGLDDELMSRLLEGRKRAGVLRPEEVHAQLIRAKLPPPVIEAEEITQSEESSVN
jgi:hypothetical protein